MGKDSLSDYVRDQIGIRQWTQADLGAKMGISAPTVSKKITGAVAWTPHDRVLLAKILGFRQLSDFDRAWRDAAKERAQSLPGPAGRIPVVNVAPAGVVEEYDSIGATEGFDALEYIDRDTDTASAGLFAVRVVGDSMEPSLFAGDHVVFRRVQPDATIEPGTVVFVRFGADSPRPGVSIGRYHRADKGWLLTKDNRRYSPVVVNPSDVVQLAACVQRRTGRV